MTRFDDLDVAGKRVFVRVDFNVPLVAGGVGDDTRIRAALPTLLNLLERGAKPVLASHLGRPEGRDASLSLEPVAAHLASLIENEVIFVDHCVGEDVTAVIENQQPGTVVVLENLRFQKGEKANDQAFAESLTEFADVYVNDAFGVSHRVAASVDAAARRFDREARAAGLLLRREMSELRRLIDAPIKPFVAIVGGAKVSDKITVMHHLLRRVDKLLIGGAMAYTFLQAQGHGVGDSRVEEDRIADAAKLLERAARQGVEVLLPSDHVAAADFAAGAQPVAVHGEAIPAGLMGLDIGPTTRARYCAAIEDAKTVFWNGPMGVFEWEAFAAGTQAVAAAVAASSAYSVVGGGDSVAAVNAAGVGESVDHVSTGGGASLELLEGRSLPGVRALEA
jgi:phosphoglycerate kinase